MNQDQLLFHASDAATKATALLERIWNDQHGTLTLPQAVELSELGRALNCATTELLNRCRGMKEIRKEP